MSGRDARLEEDDIELGLLIEAIRLRYHYDFRGYARASLRRRIAGAREALGAATTSILQDKVLRDPAAFSAVLGWLTVPVSDLFRDPEFFLALREVVAPVLATYASLRVWVAGCSTGEEAYSLAILLAEEGLLERTIIYATDINLASLRAADAGVYALDRVAQFTENYRRAGGKHTLDRYYTSAYEGIVFDRALRKPIVFSDHSLATDGVFAEMHLITCRNVLIYFDRALQDRAVGLFRDSLVRRGFLGLGARENLRFGAHEAAFDAVDRERRIYRRAA